MPEIPPTVWEQFGWLLWILIPLLLGIVGIVIRLWMRPGIPPRLIAPAAQARAALAALQSRPEDGQVLSRVSRALRRYLINAFWLQPDEATTAEFCARLQASERVGPELAAAAADFLRACDERKFSPSAQSAPLDAARRALALVERGEARQSAICKAGGTPAPS